MAEKETVLIVDTKGRAVPPGEDEDLTPEEALVRALQDLDEGAEVLLYRQHTSNHRDGLALCGSWSADVITWPLIFSKARSCITRALASQDVYFRIHIKKDGTLVKNGNKPFCIAAGSVFSDSDSGTGSAVPASPHDHVIKALQDGQAQLVNMMERIATRDPMAGLKEAFLLIGTMRREVFGESAIPAVVAATATPASPVATLTAAIKEYKALQELMPSGDGDDSIGAAAGMAIPRLFNLIEREQDIKLAAKAGGSGTRLENPAPRPSQRLPQQVLNFLSDLQEAAKADYDIEEVLDQIWANPDALMMLQQVKDIERPFAWIVEYCPAALDFPSWWGQFIEDARERLGNGSSADDEGADSGGDEGSPPDA